LIYDLSYVTMLTWFLSWISDSVLCIGLGRDGWVSAGRKSEIFQMGSVKCSIKSYIFKQKCFSYD